MKKKILIYSSHLNYKFELQIFIFLGKFICGIPLKIWNYYMVHIMTLTFFMIFFMRYTDLVRVLSKSSFFL